jgi:tetratricopeptide (TPR) repeat protein
VGDVTAERRSRANLEAERDFLLRSIEDLERERAAGDVDLDDYAELRADYVARAAFALRALEGRDEATETRQQVAEEDRWRRLRRYLGRRRTRRVLVATGVVCVIAVLGLVAAELAGLRLPGESPTGSVSLPRAQRIDDDLAAAALFANSGHEAEAVGLYDEVLTLDPRQPVALADRGWLERLAGIDADSEKTIRIGDQSIASAVAIDPHDADAHAYDAVALSQDEHRLGAAARQIALMEADHPSTSLLAEFAPTLVAIDRAAHAPVPHNLLVVSKRR